MLTDENVHQLIAKIYESALDVSTWQTTLRDIRIAFDGAGILLFYRNEKSGALEGLIQDCLPEVGLREYAEHYIFVDPRVRFVLRKPDNSVSTDFHFITEEEMRKHEYYDWLATHDGLRYFLGTKIFIDGNISVLIAIQYTGKQKDLVNLESIQLLQTFLPHLEHALKLNRRLNVQSTKLQGLIDASNLSADGVFVLNCNQKVISMNYGAEQIVAGEDGLSIKRGMLNASTMAATQVLADRISSVCRRNGAGILGEPGTINLPRPSGTPPLIVHISPIKNHENFPGFREAAVLVVVRDPLRAEDISIDHVVRLYGLTPAEARLAVGLVHGASLLQYSECNGVTRNTVRSQLKQIFSKTGTTGQTELVRMLLTGPASLHRNK